MATAPSASYPGNALLCHCVERRKEGGREDWEKSTPVRANYRLPACLPSAPPSRNWMKRQSYTSNPYPLDCHSGTKHRGLT